jgi:ADP-dependent NAD(P)H-hydrate dehydratase / NAD(P)H-hydrate epimerase
VVADTTLTVGFAKAGLLADGAANFVGRLRVLPLPELSSRAGNLALGGNVLTPESLCALLPRRQTDTQKGDYGRVGIIAGSPGFLGAAALCAAACVRSGAGLVTLYCRGEAARQLAAMVPWEVMVRTVVKLEEVHDFPHDALALGPGLGRESFEESNALIEHLPQPTVVDADGLNGLATNPAILERCAGPRILTPHPGEMARLAPELAGIARAETVRGFLRRYPRTTLLLKGSRTVIGHGDEPLAYNSTGTPGMATGGMGDILTGVIAGLLGQGLSPVHAAQVGTWLCGRAGELATDSGAETEETLTPTRLLDYLAPAFRELRSARHGRL